MGVEPLSENQERWLELKRAGICTCGRVARPGMATCGNHRHNRVLEAEKRAKAKAAGMCQRHATTPAVPGQTRCAPCAEAHRQQAKRARAKRRAV